jgi:hypothetical protein
MFSNWIYISYCLMAENQPRIKRTVLFVNLSSSVPCRNVGSSRPKLHRLFIHPFLGLHTDSAGGTRFGETMNIHTFLYKNQGDLNYSFNRALGYMFFFLRRHSIQLFLRPTQNIPVTQVGSKKGSVHIIIFHNKSKDCSSWKHSSRQIHGGH